MKTERIERRFLHETDCMLELAMMIVKSIGWMYDITDGIDRLILAHIMTLAQSNGIIEVQDLVKKMTTVSESDIKHRLEYLYKRGVIDYYNKDILKLENSFNIAGIRMKKGLEIQIAFTRSINQK